MNLIKEQYTELLVLTQQYLRQEYSLDTRLYADSETYTYFRNFIAQKRPVTALPKQSSITEVPVKPVLKSQFSGTNSTPIPIDTSKTVSLQLQPTVPLLPLNIETTASKLKKDIPNQSIPHQKSLLSPPCEDIQRRNIQPTNELKTSKEQLFFALETQPVISELNLGDLHKIIKDKYPNLALFETIPDDAKAVRIAQAWERKNEVSSVLILSFDEAPKQKAFLVNIQRALEFYGFSAQIIPAAKVELEKGWEYFLQSKHLRLVIASGYGIYALPDLLKHHKEAAKQARHFLRETPLLLLSDLSFYLKEPSLKPSLWKALKELLAISSSSL